VQKSFPIIKPFAIMAAFRPSLRNAGGRWCRGGLGDGVRPIATVAAAVGCDSRDRGHDSRPASTLGTVSLGQMLA
jgi:hypothetical protein